VGERAIVRAQSPLRLGPRSEPEPDIALVAPRADEYGSAHPSPAEVLLVVEVSDSTVRYDRDVKLPLYARHGIPEVWIVDLPGGELRFCRTPEGGRYVEQGVTKHPGVTRLAALPDVQLDLSRLLSG
jgi:Uma2 family endonuclease